MILALILFHILFFYTLYTKPFYMATSELLSTFFPYWLKGGKRDSYWLNPHAHPVLSSYYPLNAVSILCRKFFRLDTSFKIYLYQSLMHYLFASVGWYLFLQGHFSPMVSLFGAITLTYQAYHLKQQHCIIYTLAWFPWILNSNSVISSVAVGMTLLAGYYPLAAYLLPFGFFLNPDWVAFAIGLVIGLPQVIPFLKYLPKTIRGKVEAPSDSPTEKRFYFGVIPIILLLLNPQWRFLWILAPMALMLLPKSSMFRVPQRVMIISVYIAIWFALQALQSEYQMESYTLMALLVIQCLDLWLHNRKLLPPSPWCELWQRPSRAFNTKLTRFLEANLGNYKVAGLPFPLFTGHVNNLRTIGYCGSMQNKLMWKWRKSFRHDPFIDGVKDDDLSRFRVKYAFSRKKPNWPGTGVKYLYRNPAI